MDGDKPPGRKSLLPRSPETKWEIQQDDTEGPCPQSRVPNLGNAHFAVLSAGLSGLTIGEPALMNLQESWATGAIPCAGDRGQGQETRG